MGGGGGCGAADEHQRPRERPQHELLHDIELARAHERHVGSNGLALPHLDVSLSPPPSATASPPPPPALRCGGSGLTARSDLGERERACSRGVVRVQHMHRGALDLQASPQRRYS
jgi:hypothetical protein